MLYTDNLRMPFCFVSFYYVRILVIHLFHIKMPENEIFRYPGFPSITVPYAKTSDFFYSGHCGSGFIICTEWWRNGFKKISIFFCI